MSKLIVILDAKDGEVLINPSSVRLVQAQLHKETKEELWCNVFFEGIADPISFNIKYEELKRQLM
ncbi:hypothetical protein GFS24_15285 [Chitinophaga sp. SYP-B3965]|uniref:hypothetical protein n=1 Tax=Chitinophaga sp. SYP-B3965 TaxID=2663120 RepID=UPI001299F028|nr:hypothetical protein [Chitinophaga sp. SYP-B3965]MRG46485.1 hypothetical protein [Chitinophaga sp. SYP-B3965]